MARRGLIAGIVAIATAIGATAAWLSDEKPKAPKEGSLPPALEQIAIKFKQCTETLKSLGFEGSAGIGLNPWHPDWKLPALSDMYARGRFVRTNTDEMGHKTSTAVSMSFYPGSYPTPYLHDNFGLQRGLQNSSVHVIASTKHHFGKDSRDGNLTRDDLIKKFDGVEEAYLSAKKVVDSCGGGGLPNNDECIRTGLAKLDARHGGQTMKLGYRESMDPAVPINVFGKNLAYTIYPGYLQKNGLPQVSVQEGYASVDLSRTTPLYNANTALQEPRAKNLAPEGQEAFKAMADCTRPFANWIADKRNGMQPAPQ